MITLMGILKIQKMTMTEKYKILAKFVKNENKKNNFIDGEFEDIEDDNDRKI